MFGPDERSDKRSGGIGDESTAGPFGGPANGLAAEQVASMALSFHQDGLFRAHPVDSSGAFASHGAGALSGAASQRRSGRLCLRSGSPSSGVHDFHAASQELVRPAL